MNTTNPLARNLPAFEWMRFLTITVILWAATHPTPSESAETRKVSPESQVISPEVSTNRMVTFRIYAPKSEAIKLTSPDIQENVKGGAPLTKGTNGIWEVTLGPVNPGAYRYAFNVDAVPVIDPKNPAISESQDHVSSLVVVPGNDFMDILQVPHGAVASMTYYSTSLKCFRRLHVYTPPGYETGKDRYPVFYLLHGSGDCDDSWGSVGRAGFILDNLIAAGKAKPMVIVMPAGHTPSTPPGIIPGGDDPFSNDFLNDLMPLVESHYRIQGDRAHRALAGLSMGGWQTLNIGISHLDQFAYLGVFSSGVLEGFRGSVPKVTFEDRSRSVLDDASLKPGLKLLWLATGKTDFLLEHSRKTVAMLKQHGFSPVYQETDGGHIWINWRNYLNEFAPQLFQ